MIVMGMIIGRSITPLNSLRTLRTGRRRKTVRRSDDNSRWKVQKVREHSSARSTGDTGDQVLANYSLKFRRRLTCTGVYTDVYSPVRFEWDAAKSDANLRDRGFDFEFASLIFDGPTFEVEDRRREYGERRVVAIGIADGVHLTVVYTGRQGAEGQILRRIISAHRSNRRERTRYEKAIT